MYKMKDDLLSPFFTAALCLSLLAFFRDYSIMETSKPRHLLSVNLFLLQHQLNFSVFQSPLV